MAKIVTEPLNNLLWIDLEMDASTNLFDCGPLVRNTALEGEAYNEQLKNVAAIFFMALEDCFAGFSDPWDPDLRLDILYGRLQEFRLQYRRQRLRESEKEEPETINGIPAEVYNFPLTGEGYDLFGTRIANALRKGLSTDVPGSRCEILGPALEKTEGELLALRNLGRYSLSLFHRRLREKGWLQYARSRPQENS